MDFKGKAGQQKGHCFVGYNFLCLHQLTLGGVRRNMPGPETEKVQSLNLPTP